jgi:4-amino-4-deoxy-L-arabinose transferase-like glycosyltransferase
MQLASPDGHRPPRRGGRWWTLALIACIAGAMRLVLVLAPPLDSSPDGARFEDGVILEAGGPAIEELMRGSATKDLIAGPVLPYVQDYQVQSFWGGTLVVSVLAVPFFAVLGPTLVALRLTTVVFAMLTAAAVFWILDRFAGRRAAWIGGLLMAITPPGMAVFGATAYGAEVEIQAVALWMLAAFLAWADGGLRPVHGLALGALAGFSVYFGYISLPLIALLVLYVLWLEPRVVVSRAALWPLLGLALGSLPWSYYNLTHAGGGLELYGWSFVRSLTPVLSLLPGRVVDFVWLDLPGAFYLQPPLRFPLGRVVVALFAVLAVLAALRHRDSLARALRPPWRRGAGAGDGSALARVHPAVQFLAFLPFYALAYVVSNFRVLHDGVRGAFDYRYMVPLFPFLILLAGIGLDALARRSPAWRRSAMGGATTLCALFLVSNLAYCRFEGMRDGWNARGYHDAQFARSVVLRYGDDLDALTYVVEAVSRKRTPDEQQKFFFVVAQNYKVFLHPTEHPEGLDAEGRAAMERVLAHLHASAPEPYRPFFEPLAPGEPIFSYGTIEDWRRARDSRR